MKNNRFLCWCLGASLAVSLSPMLSSAQTTSTATTTGGATGTTSTGLGGGSGLGGGGGLGGTNNQTSNNSNTATAAKAVQSVTTGAGSATSIPSNSNVFVQTYVDPLSMGMASKWSQFGVPAKASGTFGKALYVNSTATNAANRGGTTTNQQGNSFSTYGTPRSPSYSTILDSDLLLAPPSAPKLQSDLRAALERSSYLSNQKNIEIIVNGSIVELRGQVATEKESRAAEGIVGMSPGVFDVINQLQLAPTNR